MDKIKPRYEKLLEKVFELEGLLTLAVTRDEVPDTLQKMIEERLALLRQVESLVDEIEEALTDHIEETLEDEEVSTEEDEEVSSDEEKSQAVESDEIESVADEFDEFESYSLSDDDDDSELADDFEELVEDFDESSEDAEEMAESAEFEEEAHADIHPAGLLRKKFSLNDMFRYSALFGSRDRLIEMIDKIEILPLSEAEKFVLAQAADKEEELREDFIEKIRTEKENLQNNNGR